MRLQSKLALVTAAGPVPEFPLLSDDLAAAFKNYGIDPTTEQIEALKAICDHYLEAKTLELRTISLRTADTLLKDYLEIVTQYVHFAAELLGGGAPGDAGLVVAMAIEKEAERLPLKLVDFGKSRLTPALRHSIASTDLAAIVRVRKRFDTELSKGNSGIQPGTAFRIWLKKMDQWARRAKFRYGPHASDTGPSAFSEFLFAVNRLFPGELKDNVLSPAALAERLKKARR